MTWGIAAKGAGVLGVGAGGLAATQSSGLMLILCVLTLLVVGTFAVVVLTAALSCHPVRRANAAAVLDRLIVAVTASR